MFKGRASHLFSGNVESNCTATVSDNAQIIWSGSMGETGDTVFAFSDDITIQPGESVTVAAKSSAGTPSYVLASLNTREDQ